jgi:mono/diheme cytochrome c family protein
MRNCDQCHPRGEAGLAPALNNKPLPAFLIKFQVRQGLGAMPSFSKDDLSDQQLDDIIRYLQALRHHQ